ncbi:transporter substrate-binding domain-containing protein [Trinickia terrae]|uniref:Transporter substrate-binding domain-containing protein n=1 Tax=Trinickia terrae TaxID=2571161 RepID=A0A4U1I2A9_9BURK|nr:transporter substrate-binding domain-containing protein [Trinickia terrae]TKC87312.1 transporter substrate-binding domain-containing protein [Trinickia terrae]
MKTRFNSFALASSILTGAALSPGLASADVRVCTFPGSPSVTLDRAVASEAFRTAGIPATVTVGAFDGSDDDGVSVKELHRALAKRCDVIAGFPRSPVADASDSKLRFSRGYLRSGYVSIAASGEGAPDATRAAQGIVAATYATPAQLIAVQQQDVKLDLENTPEQTIAALAAGHAERAIVWYPAVVAYTMAHPQQRFAVSGTTSPYAEWHLVFAFGQKEAALQGRIDTALAKMKRDGRLAALTRQWAMPATAQAALPATARFAYRDGPVRLAAVSSSELAGAPARGGFIKVDASVDADAPSFDRAQVKHGKSLYSSSCAKCHGADLKGLNAPALSGPAFAPTANSHLTIGGVFGYMATNMPADRPGKLKDQDYADIMAFLLYSNGYTAGSVKLTADGAKTSRTPLNGKTQQ